MPEGLLFRGKYVGKSRNSILTKSEKDNISIKSKASNSSKIRSIYDNKNCDKLSFSVVGGNDRPKSSIIRTGAIPLKQGKTYDPNTYFQKCGYAYKTNGEA